MQASQPLWVTVVGTLGVASFVSTVISLLASAHLQHKNWVKDNKKQEWRELIDSLREAIRVMASHYDDQMPFAVRSGEEERYREEAKRKGEVIIRDRIFISKKVRDSGLFDQWVALRKECEDADVSFKERPRSYRSFEEKAYRFQDDLIRVSREDLGID
jgi:hypothetical protein